MENKHLDIFVSLKEKSKTYSISLLPRLFGSSQTGEVSDFERIVAKEKKKITSIIENKGDHSKAFSTKELFWLLIFDPGFERMLENRKATKPGASTKIYANFVAKERAKNPPRAHKEYILSFQKRNQDRPPKDEANSVRNKKTRSPKKTIGMGNSPFKKEAAFSVRATESTRSPVILIKKKFEPSSSSRNSQRREEASPSPLSADFWREYLGNGNRDNQNNKERAQTDGTFLNEKETNRGFEWMFRSYKANESKITKSTNRRRKQAENLS